MEEFETNQRLPAALVAEGPRIRCEGSWTLPVLPALESQVTGLTWPAEQQLEFDMSGVTAMDTAGAWLLRRTVFRLEQARKVVAVSGLSAEARSLYELVGRTGRLPMELSRPYQSGMLEGLGRYALDAAYHAYGALAFFGEMATVAARLLASPLRVRWSFVVRELQEAGQQALPIVGLLSFLIGVVIAYQGGVPLQQYGASIFVADLVGLSTLRELAPLMTAIIVAGRTGSAYTAQIGTMKVTQEIEALRSIGISPLELLVLPKVLALLIALPLLTVYADIMGIIGGMVMASAQLGIVFSTFLDRLSVAVSLTSYLVGVGKAPVFAIIIATVGCYQGFQVGGSAESVGRRTTLSVVQAILLVIVTDAAFSVAFSWLGI